MTEKPGTHCSVCGELMKGEPYPGAKVSHIECLMEATKDLSAEEEPK